MRHEGWAGQRAESEQSALGSARRAGRARCPSLLHAPPAARRACRARARSLFSGAPRGVRGAPRRTWCRLGALAAAAGGARRACARIPVAADQLGQGSLVELVIHAGRAVRIVRRRRRRLQRRGGGRVGEWCGRAWRGGAHRRRAARRNTAQPRAARAYGTHARGTRARHARAAVRRLTSSGSSIRPSGGAAASRACV